MKPIVVSYDDIYLNHVRLDEFERIKKLIPGFKVTFFVIMYDFNTLGFLDSLKKDWIELVYHADEHKGDWLKWDKETAKKNILKCQHFGFAKGFKAPGWNLTKPIVEAINELDYWACICGTEHILPIIKPKKAWVTRHQHYNIYDDCVEAYGHIQDESFITPVEKVVEYYKTNGGEFKFISEMVHNYE